MSSLTIAYDPRRPQPGYLKNLATAAASLLSALLAVPQRKPDTAYEDRSLVYQMANRYEASMPNLATELRFIASRG
jgi:hypothetical protein